LASGQLDATARPVQTRFRSGSAPLALNLATSSYSPAHYAKGTRSGGSGCPEIALPPLVGATVSGSLSLPSPGFFSPFPHGTRSLSVAREYLALEGGPPCFPRGCSGPVVLGLTGQGVECAFVYRALTVSGGRFHGPSTCAPFGNSPGFTLPVAHNPARVAPPGLGSSPFARRYLGNLGWFLFLEVLRCFSSPGSPRPPMDSVADSWA
jgi:hypothetical protein